MIVTFCTVLEEKNVLVEKNPLCQLRHLPFFENIDLFSKEESKLIIPQGPVVIESHNIVSIKLDSPAEMHSSILLSTHFFQVINVCVLQREFNDYSLKISF